MPVKQPEGDTHTNLEPVDPLFWVFKPFTRRPFPIKARNPHIYTYCISSTFGAAVHEQVRAKSLADEITEIGSFTVTFRHAEVVSAGIWLAEIGHALKRTMVCFTDLNFIDDDYPPGN